MRVVTSFSLKGLRDYADMMIATFWSYWPEDVELIVYAEGCVDEAREVIGQRPNTRVEWPDWDDLRKFRETVARHGAPPDWRFDAGRFAPKGWAIADGLKDCKDQCFWVDGDVITTAPVTRNFLHGLFPRGEYLTFIGRDGLARPYTETGFIGFRGQSLWHRPFLRYFLDVWRTGKIFELPEWHDCYALDLTRKHFQLPENDLNIKREVEHPWKTTKLASCMDHLKGPIRKTMGTSQMLNEV